MKKLKDMNYVLFELSTMFVAFSLRIYFLILLWSKSTDTHRNTLSDCKRYGCRFDHHLCKINYCHLSALARRSEVGTQYAWSRILNIRTFFLLMLNTLWNCLHNKFINSSFDSYQINPRLLLYYTHIIKKYRSNFQSYNQSLLNQY